MDLKKSVIFYIILMMLKYNIDISCIPKPLM